MSKRLLIIDDAMIIRTIIKDAATEAGWEAVGEAANGAQGVQRYRELKPDAATLDLIMPEFDGLHALRGILSCDPQAKVLVVSALDQKSILKEAFHIGAADFVPKPFDKQALLDTLEQLVAAASA